MLLRVVRSAGRSGPPSRRGRSEDQPPRSSAEILTLRVEGGVVIPPSLRMATLGLRPESCAGRYCASGGRVALPRRAVLRRRLRCGWAVTAAGEGTGEACGG